ncbi:hypothetical protein B0T16DRAFT_442686 [Cercophora newfieldiana]|uniref:Uncharacterized protein n=1 Tax=Cercophora newfieldiana TaxID=92897 RepID=A0AA39YEF0_9PEZI|nr:hypothetical protein B0T16DRAFT_442686 [Cercophora newfieldiana]
MATVDLPSCSVDWCSNTIHTYRYRRGVPQLRATTSPFKVCACPALEGDSDIAGIGVITAFIAAAGLSIISTGLCLLLSRRAHGDKSHPDYALYEEAAATARAKDPDCHVLDEPPRPFNALDRFTRNWACRYAQRFVRQLNGNPTILGACFYDVVLALGDQQIVTGIAMMAAALIRIPDRDKPLSTYHFVVISDLVWFSSNAHLLALTVIRSYDDSAKPGTVERLERARRKKSAKAVRAVRAALMAWLAGLLVWASVWQGDENLYDRFQCPAACLKSSDDGKGGEPKKWMVVNIFYVVYNYPVALFMLSRRLRQWWVDRASLRIHRIAFLDDLGDRVVRGLRSVLMRVDLPAGRTLSVSAALGASIWRARPISFLIRWIPHCLWTILSSELLGFVEVVVWFSLGLWWVRGDRDYGHKLMDEAQRQTEDSWGFGQLVPWFLLVLPFMQFFESYATYSYEEACEKELKERRKI